MLRGCAGADAAILMQYTNASLRFENPLLKALF